MGKRKQSRSTPCPYQLAERLGHTVEVLSGKFPWKDEIVPEAFMGQTLTTTAAPTNQRAVTGPSWLGDFVRFPARPPPDNKNRFYFVQLPAQRSLYYSGRKREKIRPFWAIGGKKSNKEKNIFGYSMTWSCTGMSGMARAFRNEKELRLGIGCWWRRRLFIRLWKWGIQCFPS